MSGAVGSIPSLTRSGRPSFSLRSSSPSGKTSTARRARSAGNVLEVLDRDRLEVVRRLEAEDLREEREVRLERALRVLRLAKAVALPRERDVGVRHAALLERLDDHLRLRRWHDLVVEPLQQEPWARDRI